MSCSISYQEMKSIVESLHDWLRNSFDVSEKPPYSAKEALGYMGGTIEYKDVEHPAIRPIRRDGNEFNFDNRYTRNFKLIMPANEKKIWLCSELRNSYEENLLADMMAVIYLKLMWFDQNYWNRSFLQLYFRKGKEFYSTGDYVSSYSRVHASMDDCRRFVQMFFIPDFEMETQFKNQVDHLTNGSGQLSSCDHNVLVMNMAKIFDVRLPVMYRRLKDTKLGSGIYIHELSSIT